MIGLFDLFNRKVVEDASSAFANFNDKFYNIFLMHGCPRNVFNEVVQKAIPRDDLEIHFAGNFLDLVTPYWNELKL